MSTAILWLQHNLRLHDHPALHAATRHHNFIPVFIWDSHSSLGAASKVWLHHSLQQLDLHLQQKGSRLIIRQGSSREELQKLCTQTNAQAIYWERSHHYHQALEELEWQKCWQDLGIDTQIFAPNLLCSTDLRTQQGNVYRVFTPFWRSALSQLKTGFSLPPPEQLPPVPSACHSLALETLELLPSHTWHQPMTEHWDISESAAIQQMHGFLDIIADYGNKRNFPAQAATSRLSPYLHWGQISIHTLVNAIQQLPSSEGKRIFLSELGWREFAHYLLWHFPETVSEPLNQRFLNFKWNTDLQALKTWQKGQTGYPLVDAGMRELWNTGWMHNRVRMVVASFLCKDLLVDWRAGADWFWDTLVDADCANNTLGWQWTAGCGTDAAPFFRVFHPVTQSEKFDPQGHYIRKWLPELSGLSDRWIHAPWLAPEKELSQAGIQLGKDYPYPCIDHQIARQRALAAFAEIKSHA